MSLILLVQIFDEVIDEMGLIHHKASKVYTRKTNDEAVCLAVLPMNTSVMTDKGFNLFDEFAARCVHLLPQEEECTSSS